MYYYQVLSGTVIEGQMTEPSVKTLQGANWLNKHRQADITTDLQSILWYSTKGYLQAVKMHWF